MRHLRIFFITVISLLWCADFVLAQPESTKPEELDAVRKVQTHLQQNELEDAEKQFKLQVKQFPDSRRVHSLHMNFAYAYRRVEDHVAAFQHMQRLVEFYLKKTVQHPDYYPHMANALDAFSKYGVVAEKTNEVEALYTSILKNLKERTKQSDDPGDQVLGALHDVRLRMISFLIDLEKYEAADQHLLEELRQAKAEYEEKSDSPEFVLRLSNALQSRVTLRDVTGSDELTDARERQLGFLQLKAREFSDHPEILAAYLDAHIAAIKDLSRSEPNEAARLLQQSREFINEIESEERVVTQKVMIAKRTLPYLQQLVVDGQRHSKLLDQPWTSPEAISWINSDPLVDEDFEGKVVLLDFWSVWCVPCLDSFPYLSRWHDKYADRDLKVVGVTRFYNYAWDEKRDQIVKESDRDVSQKEELEVLKKFAQQKELNYPLAITSPGSDFQKNYHVVSLPQTVLIDRSGKIRMIRVGTGPTISREIERKIEELLDEKSSGKDETPDAEEKIPPKTAQKNPPDTEQKKNSDSE